MMRYRHSRRRPPSWWPANERWPPENRWRHGRRRFVRRMAVLFTALLFLSAIGAATLISKLVDGSGVQRSPVTILPVVGVTVIGMFIVALFVAAMRRFLVALGDIVEAANRVAEGDYSARVGQQGAPSMRTVGSASNTMASRLETQARQRRDLMADIAHELRTPLSVIQGRLEGLLDGVYPRDDQTIGEVIAETRLLARLVVVLRTLAHAEGGPLTLRKEPTDVVILAQEVVDALAGEAGTRRVTVAV